MAIDKEIKDELDKANEKIAKLEADMVASRGADNLAYKVRMQAILDEEWQKIQKRKNRKLDGGEWSKRIKEKELRHG